MKTTQYIILFIAMAFSACKKNEQTIVDVKGQLKAFELSTDTTYFTYNNNGLVAHIYTSFIPHTSSGPLPRMHYATTLIYDHSNRLQYVYQDSLGIGNPAYIFHYDNAGNCISIDFGPSDTGSIKNEFNNYHQLLTLSEYNTNNGILIYKSFYNYQNNNLHSNISKIITLIPDTSYTHFEYDNSNGYVATLKGIENFSSLIIPYPGLFHYYKTENNIILETDSISSHAANILSYQYQYNDANLPIKITRFQSGVLSDSATLVYY